jgi:hypothetical protein
MQKIETKVTVATVLSLVAGVLLAVLTAVQSDPTVISGLPDIVQFVLIAALPPVLTFLGGYAAPHTDRSLSPPDAA